MPSDLYKNIHRSRIQQRSSSSVQDRHIGLVVPVDIGDDQSTQIGPVLVYALRNGSKSARKLFARMLRLAHWCKLGCRCDSQSIMHPLIRARTFISAQNALMTRGCHILCPFSGALPYVVSVLETVHSPTGLTFNPTNNMAMAPIVIETAITCLKKDVSYEMSLIAGDKRPCLQSLGQCQE